jgi:mycothiol system anti-sigma-R factor
VHEYLDGELEEASAADVAHHFKVCQKCFPHLRLEERFREALRKSRSREQCPDHLRAQVLALLAVEGPEEG